MAHDYSVTGYLDRVSDDDSLLTYWQADEANAEGQVTLHSAGNGTLTYDTYDPETGRLIETRTADGLPGNGRIQHFTFVFDLVGNLKEREDRRYSRREEFRYDGLNRLTRATLTDSASGTVLKIPSFTYNGVGNLTFKGGVTQTYGAGPAGPYALTSTSDGRSYSYDANGNMIAGDGKAVTWTSYNKPETIYLSVGGDGSSFLYAPDRGRFKQVIVEGTTVTSVRYVEGLYEKHSFNSGPAELRHFIRAGGSLVALVTQVDDGNPATDETLTVHSDHLGSITALSREDGGLKKLLAFDAWGARRGHRWETAPPAASSLTPFTRRGFTGHEHLDAVGLVHMNGRVYDPSLGRFLSPDPTVPEPDSTQGLNRYAYVNNNPLSYTDPSGFHGAGPEAHGSAGAPSDPADAGFGNVSPDQDGISSQNVDRSKPWIDSRPYGSVGVPQVLEDSGVSAPEPAAKEASRTRDAAVLAQTFGIYQPADGFASQTEGHPSYGSTERFEFLEDTFLFGFGFSTVGGTGSEASVGIALNFNGQIGGNTDIGYFESTGFGPGLNISGDTFIGEFSGPIENLQGRTSNLNMVIGPLSVTEFFDIETGERVGVTYGIGPAATILGLSGTISDTEIMSINIRDSIRPSREFEVDDSFGPFPPGS